MEHDAPLWPVLWPEVVDRLVEGIPCFRLPVGDEIRLHDALERVLTEVVPGETWSREHRFDARDRVDFFASASGLAIEVKVHGSLPAVAGQLLRYAEHLDVAHLVLVTGRVHLLPLGQAWAHPRVGLTVIPLIEGQL